MTTYHYRGAQRLDPDPVLPKTGPKGGSRCGTPTGAARHYAAGEKPCEPCRIAKNEAQARRRGHQATGRANNTSPDKCGTIYGYQLHLAAAEPACFKCRVASANTRARYGARSTSPATRKSAPEFRADAA